MNCNQDSDKCFKAFGSLYPGLAKIIENGRQDIVIENCTTDEVHEYLRCMDKYDMFRTGWLSSNNEYKRSFYSKEL